MVVVKQMLSEIVDGNKQNIKTKTKIIGPRLLKQQQDCMQIHVLM